MTFSKFKFKSGGSPDPDDYAPPAADEEPLALVADWTKQEEIKAKRKLDFLLIPLLTLGFFCLRTVITTHFV